jgi:hypothetical protein
MSWLIAALATVDRGQRVPFPREGVAYAVAAGRTFGDAAAAR